jgi:hypothetical protein
MNTAQLRVLVTGLFFLFIFLSGFWLSSSGKPLNTIILTIHKLISVAVVFLVVTVIQLSRGTGLGATEITAIVATGLFFLGTIASGGLLSIGSPMPAAILTLHRITPFVTVLSTAVTLYLLLSRE